MYYDETLAETLENQLPVNQKNLKNRKQKKQTWSCDNIYNHHLWNRRTLHTRFDYNLHFVITRTEVYFSDFLFIAYCIESWLFIVIIKSQNNVLSLNALNTCFSETLPRALHYQTKFYKISTLNKTFIFIIKVSNQF